MALQFTRNATVYVVGGGAVWQLSVLDGFSFTQSINSSENFSTIFCAIVFSELT